MCGEHSALSAANSSASGSSPHVRGTPSVRLRRRSLHGIIPACAGNTPCCCPNSWRNGDHPRMCGEHTATTRIVAEVSGSSPHVRGTPPRLFCHRRSSGIIPACAGNTKRRQSWFSSRRDHPRMCGEHVSKDVLDRLKAGSSPHVRGTLRPCSVPARIGGIIPACAGNTREAGCKTPVFRDHPRMCGEHRVQKSGACVFGGSSPHVRGTRKPKLVPVVGLGIIPACAGNTRLE